MNIDKITPQNDAVFKMIFTDPKHKRLLIHFLNCALKTNDPAKSVTILNCEITKKHVTENGSRLDILAKTDKNENVNIELQVVRDKHIVGRSLFYWSKLFSEALVVNDEYGKLPRTISINILNFKFFQNDQRYYRKYHLTDDETHERVTDLLEIQFLELNKMKKYTKESPITFWVEFFNNPYSKACKELYQFVPELKEAKDIFEAAKSDPEKRRLIEERENAIRGYISGIASAKEEGREEEEEREKIAKNLLAMNLSIDQISQASGLTFAEIEALKNEV